MLTPLQNKALAQAREELDAAWSSFLHGLRNPGEFGDPCRYDTEAGKALQRIQSAKEWIDCVLKA